MGQIQTKSIYASLTIIIGFAIGAINLLILSPKLLGAELMGLTRVITDAGITVASLCTLGAQPVISKFFPFYKAHLGNEKSDLPFISGAAILIGFVLFCIVGYQFKDLVIQKFSTRSPLFVSYSYLIYPYSFFLLIFLWLEAFGWSFGKTTLTNGLREITPRVLFSLLLILFGVGLINQHNLVVGFCFSYAPAALILFWMLRKTGQFRFNSDMSNLTRRLKGKMVNFGLFVFGAQFLNLISRTADTFILASKSESGLVDTAIFTIATYVVTIMEIPQRSINSVAIPVLAESWRTHNMAKIQSLYKKSVTNLFIVGLLIFGILLLNLNNLSQFLGKDFTGVSSVVFLMGIGKLIDLGTGANSQIIGTSSYWRVDFFTNVIYTLLALPLNYYLIGRFGLMGAAYSNFISLLLYNVLRFLFLWYKFKLQPYSYKEGLLIVIGAASYLLVTFIPNIENIYLDTIVKTTAYSAVFVMALWVFNISDEMKAFISRAISYLQPKH